MDIRPKCKTCDYFAVIGAADGGEIVGSCVRRAPVAVTASVAELGGRPIDDVIPFAMWPRVFETSWCGEHSHWQGR